MGRNAFIAAACLTTVPPVNHETPKRNKSFDVSRGHCVGITSHANRILYSK